MLTAGQALQLIREHVHREDKAKHMIAVAAMMKGLARKLAPTKENGDLPGYSMIWTMNLSEKT